MTHEHGAWYASATSPVAPAPLPARGEQPISSALGRSTCWAASSRRPSGLDQSRADRGGLATSGRRGEQPERADRFPAQAARPRRDRDIPGRGYRFTMPVIVEGALRPPSEARLCAPGAASQPKSLRRAAPTCRPAPTLYGRADAVAAVLASRDALRWSPSPARPESGKTGLGRAVALQRRSGEADGVLVGRAAPLTRSSQVATTGSRARRRARRLRPAAGVDIVASVLRSIGRPRAHNCEHARRRRRVPLPWSWRRCRIWRVR